MKNPIYFFFLFLLCNTHHLFAQLYLDDVSARSIEEGIKKGPKNIKRLEIGFRASPDFTKLSLFTNLEDLSIAKEVVSTFPIEITTLSNLETLAIETPLAPIQIPKEIGKLTKLQRLNLENITNIPEELFQSNQMKSLVIRGSFANLSPKIERLTQLETLILKSTEAFILPEGIKNLSKICRLVLSHPEANISPSMLLLNNLEYLEVKSEKMQSLPDSIAKLTKLSLLHINAPIQKLPPSLTKLRNLTGLHLYNTKLKDIPCFLAELRALSSLFINGGLLNELPECLFEIKYLKELVLSNNQIKVIDERWIKLRYLDFLALENNPLEAIPETLPHDLTTVDISNTKLKTIPSAWYKRPKKQYSLQMILAANLDISLEERKNLEEQCRFASIYIFFEK